MRSEEVARRHRGGCKQEQQHRGGWKVLGGHKVDKTTKLKSAGSLRSTSLCIWAGNSCPDRDPEQKMDAVNSSKGRNILIEVTSISQ